MRCTMVALAALLFAASDVAGQDARGVVVELRVGGLNGEGVDLETFHSLVVRDSFVYVPQRSEIRVFTVSGRYVTTIGRPGRGPGEFGNILAAGMIDDTLWVSDAGNLRITLVDAAHRTVRTLTPPAGARSLVPTYLLKDGRIGCLTREASGAAEQALVAVQPARGVQDTLIVLDRSQRLLVLRTAGSAMHMEQPFNDSDLLSVSPTGDRALSVKRREAGKFVAAFHDFASGAVRQAAYTVPAVPIEAATVDRIVRELTAGLQFDPRDPVTADALRKALYVPDAMPAVDAAAWDTDGGAWVRLGGSWEQKTRLWMKVTPDGGRVSTVRVPATILPMLFSGNTIWGKETDESRLPYLVRLRMIPK